MVGDKEQDKKKKNSGEIEAYLKPSWVLASTKNIVSDQRLSSVMQFNFEPN
jgi:hypothetical protein